MDERIIKWFIDIQGSIEEIESFLRDVPKSFSEYQKNHLLKRAIERNLEIIGEAMNRIVTKDPDYLNKVSEARNIVGLRNQIIHAYDSISDENIWSILIGHLPKLKEEVETILK